MEFFVALLPLDVGSAFGSFLVEDVLASAVGFFDLDDSSVGFFCSTLVVPLDMALSDFRYELPPDVPLSLAVDEVVGDFEDEDVVAEAGITAAATLDAAAVIRSPMERPGAAADGLATDADAGFSGLSASLVRGLFPSSFSADSGGSGRFGMAQGFGCGVEEGEGEKR